MHAGIPRLKTALVFLIATALYYFLPVEHNEIDQTFLTVSTFLFTIFAGFFVSRQGARYSRIRESIASFDGIMTTFYRLSSQYGAAAQKQVGDAIHKYYKPIINTKQWDYGLTHKISILTDLTHIVQDAMSKKKVSVAATPTTVVLFHNLASAQQQRKHMVSLREERIPGFQWSLLYLLTAILIITLSISIASHGIFIAAVLKGSFTTVIVVVLFLLQKLDRLELFEGTIGEHSTQDTLAIIKGTK